TKKPRVAAAASTVPVVGCAARGGKPVVVTSPVDMPKLNPPFAQSVARYTSDQRQPLLSVLGPRDWKCRWEPYGDGLILSVLLPDGSAATQKTTTLVADGSDGIYVAVLNSVPPNCPAPCSQPPFGGLAAINLHMLDALAARAERPAVLLGEQGQGAAIV